MTIDLCVCVSHSRVQLFVTPRTVAHQGPLYMGFSTQEYLSGLPFPSPGDRSSWPRDWTWASRTASRLFTDWATRQDDLQSIYNNRCTSWSVANHITTFKVHLWLIPEHLLFNSCTDSKVCSCVVSLSPRDNILMWHFYKNLLTERRN